MQIHKFSEVEILFNEAFECVAIDMMIVFISCCFAKTVLTHLYERMKQFVRIDFISLLYIYKNVLFFFVTKRYV